MQGLVPWRQCQPATGGLVEELRVEESKVCRTVEDMLYRDHLGHRGFLGETCGYVESPANKICTATGSGREVELIG